MLMAKCPPQGDLPLAMPTPADVRIFRVTLSVKSVLDYSKGFGHADSSPAKLFRHQAAIATLSKSLALAREQAEEMLTAAGL